MSLLFQFATFASTAGGLRNRNAAVFASLKKQAAHFFNSGFIVSEPKNAANPVTGEKIAWWLYVHARNHVDWNDLFDAI